MPFLSVPRARSGGFKTVLLLLTLQAWCVGTRAETPVQREYALKAACLFNFCHFITWPADAFESPTSPIVIGILGADPFGYSLEMMVHGEQVRGRRIQVARFRRVEEALHSHLLFVSASEAARLPSIFRTAQRRRMVTVGESDYFLAEGGMIALTIVENKVRLRINLPAARSAGVNISSKLLRVADIVQ